MTADKDNYHYLRGFVDGYGGEEPHDDFPDGLSNINEVWDRMYELKEEKKPWTQKGMWSLPTFKNILNAAEHYFYVGHKEYAGLWITLKLIKKIRFMGYSIKEDERIETPYGSLYVHIFDSDYEGFYIGDGWQHGKDENERIVRFNPLENRLEECIGNKVTPLEEAVS